MAMLVTIGWYSCWKVGITRPDPTLHRLTLTTAFILPTHEVRSIRLARCEERRFERSMSIVRWWHKSSVWQRMLRLLAASHCLQQREYCHDQNADQCIMLPATTSNMAAKITNQGRHLKSKILEYVLHFRGPHPNDIVYRICPLQTKHAVVCVGSHINKVFTKNEIY